MSKYSPLTHHLQTCAQPEVPMHFAKIEAILGFALPPSARQHRGWWSNNPVNNVMTKAWLAAGYTTRAVDLAGEHLVFAKSAPAPTPPIGFAESPAPIWAGQAPKVLLGDHPLFGCMAGTVRIEAGFDLTAPLFADSDVEAWMDQKAAHLRGAPQ
ncbi:MAG: hypothetical protein WCO04_13760 [Pseudomonadota bacterium]